MNMFAPRQTAMVALAVAGLSLGSAPALAEAPVFRWAPDDLITLERIAATHERIESDARDYCRDHLRGTRGLSGWRDCVNAVTSEIVASVDDVRLTAYATTGTVDEALLAAVPARANNS